ncbi:SAM-dependent methyltransferase [Crossiella equi]|uniref:SAM-dependent methyltransferase n=1 Tax=Crossiella equi TaxID=130796 RepID=A0ABS5ACG3_9PSEU|nr:SAM-dependent methyltransferase [Crossiella equi]MBP2474278.1 SAM-dependent methyltransferase [Crossiella equi]
MEQRLSWVPKEVDVSKPSAARVYDYFLGGGYNFAVDRAFAQKLLEVSPTFAGVCQHNRSFLRRAVLHMLDNGIRQFLDIGSGLPTTGNVHEIAQAVDPSSRVVYVDNEPVAIAHSELMLKDNDRAVILHADVRDPDWILGSPQTRELIDFREPVGLLMVALLHFVPPEDQPEAFLRRYRDALAPGSFFALSQGTEERQPPEVHKIKALYNNSPNKVTTRTSAEITAFLGDFEVLEPGLVFTPEWRPEVPSDVPEQPELAGFYAIVGRKR